MSRNKALNFYIPLICILMEKSYINKCIYLIIYKMKVRGIINRLVLFMIFWTALFNFSIASDWNLPWVTIISRSEWWADESIRLLKSKKTSTSSTTTQTEAQIKAANISKIRNAWMSKYYPNERKYEWSRTMSWSYYLIYPEYFNHHKNKIVIHHTAMDYDPNWTIEEVKNHLQKIYKYHTINRSFGDIGYNFLIDQLWNIYEWRSGWEWAVWMHASSNNVSSIWIALLWNFENDMPTEAQLSALVNLTTAIARFYNIDPYGTTHTFTLNTTKEPYVTAEENFNIMWHRDIKATACPWKNIDALLPKIREEVAFRLKNWIVGDVQIPSSWLNDVKSSTVTKTVTKPTQTTSNTKTSTTSSVNSSTFSERFLTLKEKSPALFNEAAQEAKKRYNGDLPNASNLMQKITKKYSINEINNLLNKDISVLLYELTTKYDSFEIRCDSRCVFDIDDMKYIWSWATLTFLSNKIQVASDRNLSANKVSVVSSNGGIVEIVNYKRKSYVWIPWNTFKWKLSFEKWLYPLKNWEQKSDFIVINTLPFSDYMRWIVETNDTETLEKNKLMAMISKNYALFYLDKENVHPSIAKDANYSAIDDPDFFQKYVWAWLEKTLTKWYQALEVTESKVVMYDEYLPILPYFSCSAWFTLSAKEKWWRTDTPYLESTLDFDECDKFSWHWVWLSGKWAEWLAQKWMDYEDILKYYYSGVEIRDIIKS